MKPFQIVNAQSTEHAVQLLGEFGAPAGLIASGADILDLRKAGIEGPRMPPKEIFVRLDLAALRGIRSADDGGIAIGAMTTLTEVAANASVRARYPALTNTISRIASLQLRNTSTVAGNLCQRPRCLYFRHPDIVCLKKGGDRCWAIEGDNRYYHAIFEGGPCHIVCPSDLATTLVALDASLRIRARTGVRVVRVEDLYRRTDQSVYQEHVLGQDEIIESIQLPALPARASQTFAKATVRATDEFALVAVAVTIAPAERVEHCRIALGGVAPRPLRARGSEAALLGRALSVDAIEQAAEIAVRDATPMSGNAFKIALTRRMVADALREAARA